MKSALFLVAFVAFSEEVFYEAAWLAWRLRKEGVV
jgi:hypothetical protein